MFFDVRHTLYVWIYKQVPHDQFFCTKKKKKIRGCIIHIIFEEVNKTCIFCEQLHHVLVNVFQVWLKFMTKNLALSMKSAYTQISIYIYFLRKRRKKKRYLSSRIYMGL